MTWMLFIYYALAIAIGGTLGVLAYRLSPTGRAQRARIKELKAQINRLDTERIELERQLAQANAPEILEGWHKERHQG